MPVYEFYNLPALAIPSLNAALLPKMLDPARIQLNQAGVRVIPEGENPFAESAAPDQMAISVSAAANPSTNGWIGRGPEWFSVTIHRRVKTFTNAAAATAQNIAVGDLPLYKLAVMSTHPTWDCSRTEPTAWPKVHLELDTQNGVRRKYDMERLVIDGWSLEIDAGNAGEISEVLEFRAWVVEQSLPQGNGLTIALGNSD